MQKYVYKINGSFINLSLKYHSCSFQFHIVLTSPIWLLPCFHLSVHQWALENQWEVLLWVCKYSVRMMTEIIQYLAFLPYLHNEQWHWEKCSYYLMSKCWVKGWFFQRPHPDENMRQILFGFEILILTLNICSMDSMLLYHFDWFGHHASQGLWSWPNSFTCPTSQPLWPTTFGGFRNGWKRYLRV